MCDLRHSLAVFLICAAMTVVSPFAVAQQELLMAETPISTVTLDGSHSPQIPVSFHIRDTQNPIASYRLGLRHTTMGIQPFSNRTDPSGDPHDFQSTGMLNLPVNFPLGTYEIVVRLVDANGQSGGWLSAPSPDFLEVTDTRSWALNSCRDSRHDLEILMDVPGEGGDTDLICVCAEAPSGCSPVSRSYCTTQASTRPGLPVVLSTPADGDICVYALGATEGIHIANRNRFPAYWAQRIVPSSAPPEFSVTKTVESCESFGPNAHRCVYNIRIENNGGPYTGELQVEDVTNQSVNGFYLFDENRTPLSCQVHTSAGPQPLAFSDGSISSSRFDVCVLPNVSIDASTPIELTALAQLGGPVASPPDAPLNCAVIVMWDGRPSGMQTGDFPSSCVPALTPAVSTQPGFTSARDNEFPDANWSVDHCPDVDVGAGRSTYTAGHTASDGNPAPAYAVSHAYNLRIALCHVYEGGVVTLDRQSVGGLEFSYEATGTHAGRIIVAPLVVQDGRAYWGRPWATVGGTLTTYSRLLNATDFTPVYADPATAQHPDFGCGAPPFNIGFVTANQTGPGSVPTNFMHRRSAVVDNWSFEADLGDACD